MHKPRHPVKAAGPKGPNDRRQRRYEKLCVTIERRQRKLDRDQRSVERGVKALAKMERDRRRMQKAMAKAERDAADALVADAVAAPAPVEPKPVSAVTVIPNSEVFGDDLADIPTWLERKPVEAKPKPKRQRKPKAADAKPESGSPGPALMVEAFNRPLVAAREARMQSMGFRKTSKRR